MSKRRKIRVPQGTFTASIHNLSHEGRGVTQIDGKTVFIRGALPKETVEFIYTKRHSRFDEGRLSEVIDHPHSTRVEAPCPHFALCGGCSLQHMSLDEQLTFKKSAVKEQFKHIGKTEPQEWLPTLKAEPFGYRRRARLSVKWVEKKGGIILGFHEKDFGHFITPIEMCLVMHKKVGERLPDIRTLIASLDTAQHIPQIEVAVGDDSAAIIFRHLEPLTTSDQQKLSAFGHTHQFKIFTQPAGPDSVSLLSFANESPYLSYPLPQFDLVMSFLPMDFTQVNFEVNQLMVQKAVELLHPQPDDHILDLFCGLGNFSLALARKAKRVIGVEGSSIMVERATMNALQNHITNCEFHAADLTKPLTQAWAQAPYQKLLLDPARTGALEIVQTISLWYPERIVYVSCNPATLARDMDILVNQHGYRLEKAGIMDMFPHTTHIETIALFTRKTHGKS